PVKVHQLRRAQAFHRRALEDDGGAAEGADLVDLLAVEADRIPLLPFDERPGDETSLAAQSLPGHRQDLAPLLVGEEVDVPGVHVHRRTQAGLRRPANVLGKLVEVDASRRGERHQDGGMPLDLSPRLDPGDHVLHALKRGGFPHCHKGPRAPFRVVPRAPAAQARPAPVEARTKRWVSSQTLGLAFRRPPSIISSSIPAAASPMAFMGSATVVKGGSTNSPVGIPPIPATVISSGTGMPRSFNPLSTPMAIWSLAARIASGSGQAPRPQRCSSSATAR